MTDTLKAAIVAVTILLMLLLPIVMLVGDNECLIYGIDFNGNRDWFGLFCWR